MGCVPRYKSKSMLPHIYVSQLLQWNKMHEVLTRVPSVLAVLIYAL